MLLTKCYLRDNAKENKVDGGCVPRFGGIPYASVLLHFVSVIEMSDVTRFDACG